MTSPDYGPFWCRSGVMFVQANSTTLGPTEYLPAIRAAGYGFVAFNVATGEWPDERRIASAQHLDVVPWLRVRNLVDLDTLRNAQKRWDSPGIIPNVEIEDTRQAVLMARVLEDMSHAGKALLITDGWADPLGLWHGYRRWVGSVECFPEEFPPYADVNGCVLHASSFFRAVIPALGAYGRKWKGRLPVRSDYAWSASSPAIVYPGDTVANWKDWPA